MKAFIQQLDFLVRERSPVRVTTKALIVVVLLGFVDCLTGPQFSLAIFYLLPIVLASWSDGRLSGLITACASAVTWLVADFASSGGFERPAIPFWNSLVRLALFLIVVHLLTTIKRQNENLAEAVEQKTAALHAEMLERSRVEQAVLEISGQEQRRIAHELHDGLGQLLTYSALKAKMLAEDLAETAPLQVSEANEMAALLNKGTEQVRRFARGLDPIDVEASGLTTALDRLVKETESLGGIRCSFTFSQAESPLGSSTSLHLYRIAQEAISNAVKHSQGRGVEVELNIFPAQVALKIMDDGVGFDPEKPAGAGMGIQIMRYRARTLGGVLVLSSALGQGTTVECVVPVAQNRPLTCGDAIGLVQRNAKAAYSHR
ncbi:MAG: sensor histidine kinase [Verrucomicrobia bacterium]|nr:sensor histidine kinase [Verrucomicrobiota bacterium]